MLLAVRRSEGLKKKKKNSNGIWSEYGPGITLRVHVQKGNVFFFPCIVLSQNIRMSKW